PLLQSWLARRSARPYRLFAVSNAASLGGLLAYPFVIEPLINVRAQAVLWSAGFVAFGIACAAAAVVQARPDKSEPASPVAAAGRPAQGGSHPWLWLALSALGSLALVSVT